MSNFHKKNISVTVRNMYIKNSFFPILAGFELNINLKNDILGLTP